MVRGRPAACRSPLDSPEVFALPSRSLHVGPISLFLSKEERRATSTHRRRHRRIGCRALGGASRPGSRGPRIGPPDKIVQRPEQVIFLYDDVTGNFFRIVPTDGRAHRDDLEPGQLGDAIGHWEGDTLVVETVGFSAETWLTDDGSFHTENLRVVERISRDADTLTWQATAYDPDVLAEPWELRPRTAFLTDVDIVEAPPCIERSLGHMVDKSNHDNAR